MRAQWDHARRVMGGYENLTVRIIPTTARDDPAQHSEKTMVTFGECSGRSGFRTSSTSTPPISTKRRTPIGWRGRSARSESWRSRRRKRGNILNHTSDKSEPADTGWFKSSFIGDGNDQCVECRIIDSVGVLVRDSKNRAVASSVHRGRMIGFSRGDQDRRVRNAWLSPHEFSRSAHAAVVRSVG